MTTKLLDVRKPPRPPFEGRKGVLDGPGGILRRRCAWCGTEVTGRRRTWCSEGCVWTWRLIAFPAEAAAHLFELGGHTCWNCGEPGWPDPKTPWGAVLEMDHRRPLWSLSPQERSEHRWWLPFNLWMLCRTCHAAKTAAEAAERAALRRYPTLRLVSPVVESPPAAVPPLVPERGQMLFPMPGR